MSDPTYGKCVYCGADVEYVWWGEWLDAQEVAICESPDSPVGRHDGNE